jgi:multidrug transporter EmrE-like cation transporter
MYFYYAMLAAGIFFGVVGQIVLKAGADRTDTVVQQFLHPLTVLGFGIYAAAAIFYVIALKRIPVSIAFPSVSASYILVAVLAHFLWNEPFGFPQVAGIVLIGGGIFLLHQ